MERMKLSKKRYSVEPIFTGAIIVLIICVYGVSSHLHNLDTIHNAAQMKLMEDDTLYKEYNQIYDRGVWGIKERQMTLSNWWARSIQSLPVTYLISIVVSLGIGILTRYIRWKK